MGKDVLVTGDPVSTSLEPDPGAPAEAREFLRSALVDLVTDAAPGQGGMAFEELLIAANELVTNAVVHAGTALTLTVHCRGRDVRVEVTDGSGRPPESRHVDLDATNGRGMAMIDGLGLTWGATAIPGGKVVWLETSL